MFESCLRGKPLQRSRVQLTGGCMTVKDKAKTEAEAEAEHLSWPPSPYFNGKRIDSRGWVYQYLHKKWVLVDNTCRDKGPPSDGEHAVGSDSITAD